MPGLSDSDQWSAGCGLCEKPHWWAVSNCNLDVVAFPPSVRVGGATDSVDVNLTITWGIGCLLDCLSVGRSGDVASRLLISKHGQLKLWCVIWLMKNTPNVLRPLYRQLLLNERLRQLSHVYLSPTFFPRIVIGSS